MSRPVLVTGHGADRDAVNAARRTVPYRTLVVVTTRPGARDLAALRETEALMNVDVRVEAVDAADFMGILAAAGRVLDAHAADDVKVHVAGGPNLVTNALLVAAFQKGVEAFYCHARGVSRLPVAKSVDLAERFTATERQVLAAIPAVASAPIADVVAATTLSPTTVKSALLRFRARGLAHTTRDSVSLTATGRYYRAHFAGDEARARVAPQGARGRADPV